VVTRTNSSSSSGSSSRSLRTGCTCVTRVATTPLGVSAAR
jgi:hypothetical protein